MTKREFELRAPRGHGAPEARACRTNLGDHINKADFVCLCWHDTVLSPIPVLPRCGRPLNSPVCQSSPCLLTRSGVAQPSESKMSKTKTGRMPLLGPGLSSHVRLSLHGFSTLTSIAIETLHKRPGYVAPPGRTGRRSGRTSCSTAPDASDHHRAGHMT